MEGTNLLLSNPPIDLMTVLQFTCVDISDDCFLADLQLHWHLKRFGS